MKELSDYTDKQRTKIKKYKECMFKYGYFTLCFLICVLEEEENYEECELIVAAINDMNNNIDVWSTPESSKWRIPTELSIDSIKTFKDECKMYNVNYELRIFSIPYSAIECLNYVNKQ